MAVMFRLGLLTLFVCLKWLTNDKDKEALAKQATAVRDKLCADCKDGIAIVAPNPACPTKDFLLKAR